MSGEKLEQEEIDALLHGVDSGAVDTGPRPADQDGVAREYDFAAQSRIVRGRMPALELVNERMARALRVSLNSMLRRPPDLTVQGISMPKYSEYAATLGVPTSLNQIRLQPLAGNGLLVFQAPLVFAMIDAFFGGSGRETRIGNREFTPTENHLIDMLMEQIIVAAQEAWQKLLPVRIEFVSREANPQFASFVGPTEIVVVNRFSIEVGGRGGEVHVVLPFPMLEPLKDMLRAGVPGEGPKHQEQWSRLLRNELEESEVDVVTRLGMAHTTVSRLIDMRPGDVIPIEFDGQATVLADGIPLFRGELGQQRGQQVVRVGQTHTRKTTNSLDAFVRKTK